MSKSWNENRSVNNNNASNYLALKNPTYSDWEVATLFYSALHLVDAFVLKTGLPKPGDHFERNEIVRKNQSFQPIRKQYSSLYILSKSARYVRDVTPDEVSQARECHSSITSYISSLLQK